MKSVLGSYLTGVGLPIEPCRVYWGSHGCMLPSNHHFTPNSYCRCECAADEDGNVGAYPYYGDGTWFYGDDATRVWGTGETSGTPVMVHFLSSADPEPPPGTGVTDSMGRPWSRDSDGDANPDGFANWTRDDADNADPESWVKVGGNYGPVWMTRADGDAYLGYENG